MDLSIVIPALNEEEKIAADVEAAAAFLRSHDLLGEIVVVDDGSGDGTAARAEGARAGEGVSLRVIRHEENHGKGCAVRTGMGASRGSYVLFADSGLCVSFEDARRGLAMLRSGVCDIAHGSRFLPGSRITRRRGPYRRLVSWTFRLALSLLGHARGLTDPQCGFKLYRGEVARELYGRCVCDGYVFDLEVILRARRAGYRIEEFPVEWRTDPDSRLHPARALPGLIGEYVKLLRSVGCGGEGAA
jgi:dolichyl-phosphate beta-glucosyltransferase